MPWKEGDEYPYDGWYNGNPLVMIANGTYEYFRPKLEQQAKSGNLANPRAPEEDRINEGMTKLKQWDDEWSLVSDEEKQKRFEVVMKDTTPYEATEMTNKGPVKRVRRKPSENNNLDPDRRKGKKKRVHRKLRGKFSKEDAPKKKKRSPTE